MQATTDYKDGWLVIKEIDYLTDEPVQQITYWPVKRETKSFLDNMEILGKEVTYRGSGLYSVRLGPYQYLDLALAEAGSTRPIAFESVPVEPPKARKGQTIRWRNGRFEKCTHRTGWAAL